MRLPFLRLPSLRSRLLFSFWLLILISLWLPFAHYRKEADRDILLETQELTEHKLELLDWLIRDLEVRGSLAGPSGLQDWIVAAGRDLDVRITYVALDGKVLADSQVSSEGLAGLENHADRPEVLAAGEGDYGRSIRHSATLDRDLLYLARRVQGSGGLPSGTLRLAAPFSVLRDRLAAMTGDFAWLVLATFLVTSLSSQLLSRRLRDSIQALASAAEDIARGDWKKRIRLYPGREFAPLAEAINTMAESIDGNIRTIGLHKGRIQAILDGMKEGVMVLDGRGRVVTLNRAMRAILPGAAHPSGRAPLELTLNPDLQRAVDRVLAEGAGGDGPVSLQIELRRDQFFHVSLSPVRAQATADEVRKAGRGDWGVIAVFHDITGMVRLARMRREFVANVSHELKTPLTSIRGYAETVMDNPDTDPDTRRRFLEVILKNANHMIRMVTQMLELSRLEAETRIELAEVDATQVLAMVFQTLAHEAEARGVRLDSRLGSPVRVRASAEALGQVFRNLLENGVRYSPAGGAVTVSAERREGQVLFIVADQGPGIPRDSLERVFERFYTVKDKGGEGSDKSGGGTGLGLAICRHIVRAMGGEIRVESPVPGAHRGAAFAFSLDAA